MRVLVTGGLGYVGRAVSLELLATGNYVVALAPGSEAAAPAGVEVVNGDLRDGECVAAIVRDGSFDAVVHLAALARARDSVSSPHDYQAVNVGGTENLLRALDARAQPVRFVFASTAMVYGSRHDSAVDEDVDPAPDTPYGRTKLAAERLVAAHAAGGTSAAVILRIFNVGGAVAGVADPDRSRIIPLLLSVAAGERAAFTLLGEGSAIRDFVHVADVALAARAALERAAPGASRVYNVGSGVGTRVIDVVRCVEETTGQRIAVEHAPDEGAPGRLVADVARARRDLDWSPARSQLSTIVADAWAAWPGRA